SVANIITASFGVCTKAPDKDASPETLIECADKAMYLAKKQGRNKVVSYQNVSEE
ncbi:MAG: diguanylate cyclase, partial [Proteobacteria bacterium]|nr:diguanylate cyclase [Pseudomonadota bacterium]